VIESRRGRLATTCGVEELSYYLPGVALTKSVRLTPGYFIEPAPGFFFSEQLCSAVKRSGEEWGQAKKTN
jgi:hypothetical protein